MLLGVISDTHGYLDLAVPPLFAGVEHILHAGDVGPARLITELEQIAPVTAVLGNTDSFLNLRETEIVELAGRRILVHHIVDPEDPDALVKWHRERVHPDLIVFGHTHRPFWGKAGARQFLNPGYAGKPRFDLPRSVALLRCEDGEFSVEFKPLAV